MERGELLRATSESDEEDNIRQKSHYNPEPVPPKSRSRATSPASQKKRC